MSAIFGIFGEAESSEVEMMSSRLSHRGAFGVAWSPSARLHFGQRVGTPYATGQGPYDRPINLCGFVDNRKEIAALLGWPEDSTTPFEDSRLVYEVFCKWGPEGFARLTGQFALAIWDIVGRRLVLARDAWSSCPLFLTQAAERIAFASEYKALLCLADVRAEPNRNAIQYIHCTKYSPPDASCLLGVDPVPAGGWVELTSGEIRRKRYMNLAVQVANRSDSDHARALRESLIDVVRRQVEPYPDVGVALSGGLDSALIVGTIHHVAPQREIHTFTAGFGRDDGEVGKAAVVAKYFGTTHHEVFLSSTDIPSLMPKVLWHMEDPIGREEKLFYFVTARAAQEHVQILLAGHNADGLFAGMPRHRVVKMAALTPVFKSALGEFFRYTQTGAPAASFFGKLLVSVYFRGSHAAPPDVIGATQRPHGDVLRLVGRDPMSELLRRGLLEDPNANSAIERIHAASDVQFNSPFLDTDLVRCSLQIPDRLKIKGWRQKYVLRQAGVGLLPDGVLNRKKGLLRLKHDKTFCDVLDAMADDLLAPAAVAARGLFQGNYVERIRRRPGSGIYPADQLYRLWSLLLSELWARLFIDYRGDIVR